MSLLVIFNLIHNVRDRYRLCRNPLDLYRRRQVILANWPVDENCQSVSHRNLIVHENADTICVINFFAVD